ncbi:hypothetical protein RFI_32996, partial [Reticulomyxa filosa]
KLNVRKLIPGTSVEFTVTENSEKSEDNDNFRAGIVTAAGGRPFCDTRGSYGRYLAKRFDFAKPQKELSELSFKEGEKYNGWISSFNGETKKGTIEVEAPEGERYRKVLFELNNAKLGDQVFDESKVITSGTDVVFEVRAIPDDKKTYTSNDGKEIESTLSQEAFNVTAIDSEILRLKTRHIHEEQSKKESIVKGNIFDVKLLK